MTRNCVFRNSPNVGRVPRTRRNDFGLFREQAIQIKNAMALAACLFRNSGFGNSSAFRSKRQTCHCEEERILATTKQSKVHNIFLGLLRFARNDSLVAVFQGLNYYWLCYIFLLFNLFFIFNGPIVFAEDNNDLNEKIKWLNILESSLRKQSEKSLELEKILQEEQEINVYLYQELKGLNSETLFSLNKSIREKRRELEGLINQRSSLVRRLSKIIFAKQSANKQAFLMRLKSQAVRNAEIEKIKNHFEKEKQKLEAKIFLLERELVLKNSQFKTAVTEKAYKEDELRNARDIYAKEKSVLEKAMQFQLDNCAASQGIVREKKELEDKLIALKESYQKQMANLYYYLGLAYTQAKIYPDAINAYSTSLQYEPNNPQAYYNLGLLYQYQENNSEKAIYHLRQSLRLDSSGQKRKTIEALIRTLSKEK